MLEQYRLAIQQLKVAAELAPNNPQIFHNLAAAYQHSGLEELAESAYKHYQKLTGPK